MSRQEKRADAWPSQSWLPEEHPGCSRQRWHHPGMGGVLAPSMLQPAFPVAFSSIIPDGPSVILPPPARPCRAGSPRSRLGELDDDLDVLRRPLQGAHEILRPLASRHEACQPRAVRAGQGFTGLVPVPLVGVDAADDDIVPEHRFGRDVGRGEPGRVAAGPDAGQTDDAARPDGLDRIGDDLPDARAFDDDVRLESDIRDAARCGMSRRGRARVPAWAPIRRGRGRGSPARAACPTRAARRPIGPAPVTSTVRGSQKARWPTATICSHAFVTTVVGSSSTPRRPRERSTFMTYSGSIRQRSDMKPSICLMPRSVYWPFRHMSHSPTAQLGQGTGSGRRTMPTTRSPS